MREVKYGESYLLSVMSMPLDGEGQKSLGGRSTCGKVRGFLVIFIGPTPGAFVLKTKRSKPTVDYNIICAPTPAPASRSGSYKVKVVSVLWTRKP
jgi:hypothetical protein